MARGALKGLKRNRPSPNEKVLVKGQLPQPVAGRSSSGGKNTVSQQGGNVPSCNGSAEVDGGELSSWLNCECFFSLVLVGLLAALPFNLHTQELMQTPESYLARAAEFSKEGAFDKAASLYERALHAEETPERHLLLAETLVEAERRDEALLHYERAASTSDDRQDKVLSLLSLGRAQIQEGLSHDAVRTYLQVLDLQIDEDAEQVAHAHFEVAESLLLSHNHSEAVKHLELATALAPDSAPAHELLAHTLRDMGLVEEAIRRYKIIVAQQTTDIETLVHLGFAYHELCDFSQALAIYKRARSVPAKTAEMDYVTAALHSQSFHPPYAPPEYVSDLFALDTRKAAFLHPEMQILHERVNGGTQPRDGDKVPTAQSDRGMFHDVHGLIFNHVPENIREMLEAVLGLSNCSEAADLQWLDILDLGSGQGRIGTLLRPIANTMTGVDLCEEAIKHASQLGVYDDVVQEDVIVALQGMVAESVDVVVAADLLPYVGDLADLMRASASVTRPGGLLVFNADAMEMDADANSGAHPGAYDLGFTGRWSHHRRYVTHVVETSGLQVLHTRVVKGYTHLVSPTAGEIVLESVPKERHTIIYLCSKKLP